MTTAISRSTRGQLGRFEKFWYLLTSPNSVPLRKGRGFDDGQPQFIALSDLYEALSAAGDPLERLPGMVDFGVLRAPLISALRHSVRAKGGRPPFDLVMMFIILVPQALYSL